MYKCIECNISFKNRQAYSGHCLYHANLKRKKEKIQRRVKCEYCDKEYSIRGIYTHIWRRHGNGIFHNPNRERRIAWNKGLTKYTDERVLANSISTSRTFRRQLEDGTYIKRGMTEEGRRKTSIRMSARNPGGKVK